MSKPASSRRLVPLLLLAVAGASATVAVLRLERGTGSLPAPPVASVASPEPPPSAAAPASSVSAAPPLPPLPPLRDELPPDIPAQREVLFENMKNQLGLSEDALEKTREIFAGRKWMGQGNPKITQHPMSRAECQKIRAQASFHAADARCGSPNMVTIFDPTKGETTTSAKLCIDQYEYPNIPCDYPVTWVPSDDAQRLCRAQGKRLCDAHEWEGACAGAVLPPEQEYTFGERRLQQEYLHNKSRDVVWAYGKVKNHALCATGSRKSPKCYAPTWQECGSNTYPAGAFPECVSSFGVYDQHGNAAEHMNLPLVAEEMGSRGGTGDNEMKGSWFIFQQYEAHLDDCRWRAPAWHAGRVMADDAHMNYHLSFRCCKDL